MNKFTAIYFKSAKISLIISIAFIPSLVFGTSTTFAPSFCPAQVDLSTHMTDEIDDRVVGLTANDTTKKIFTSQNHSGQTYVRNSDVWTNNGTSTIDLTGLSPWNSTNANRRAGTLISPRHIVFATHYQIGTGATVRFVTNDGTVVNRTMTAKTLISGDAYLGVLDEDVPETITHYPIISKPDLDKYLSNIKVPMLVLDQEEKALIRDVTSIGSGVGHTVPPATTTRNLFNETLISGDSGNPAFIVVDGKPALMLTHHTAGGGPSYSYYLDEVNSAMATLGGGYEASSYDLSCFNAKPVITNESLLFTVNEYATSTTVVGTIIVDDEDVENLTFEITSGNTDDVFGINSDGEIFVALEDILNFQEKAVYSLGIAVTDSADIPMSTSETVTINVDNELDIPVILTSEMSVPENDSDGYTLGEIEFFSETATTTFAKVSGYEGFSVTEDGEVNLESGYSLDYESQDEYEIEVMIENEAGSSTSAIIVNVTDENDAPNITTTSLSVVDGSVNGTVVGTISVSDQDAEDEHIFSIDGGNTSSAFALDAYSGQIIVNNSSAINRSINTSINLEITAQDAGSLTDTKTITVNITAQPSSGGGGGGGGSSSHRLNVSCDIDEDEVAPGSKIIISATADDGEEPYEFEWSGDINDLNIDIDQAEQYITFNEEGEYELTVTVTDEDGDEDDVDCDTITVNDKYELFNADEDETNGDDTESQSLGRENTQNSPLSSLSNADKTELRNLITILSLLNMIDQTQSGLILTLLGGDNMSSDPTVSSVSNNYVFNRDLELGAVGEDVRQLQKFLNSNGFVVATNGAGSAGNETTYFGPATQAALIRFQIAKGITPASGYFGPITRGFIN
jgi:hypothetical protein